MKCRYCGDNLHSTNRKLLSSLGEKCLGNPAGVHIGVTDGVTCVYCGDVAKYNNGKLITRLGYECPRLPTGKHYLQ